MTKESTSSIPPGADDADDPSAHSLRENIAEKKTYLNEHAYKYGPKGTETRTDPESRGAKPIGKRGLNVADLVKFIGLIAVFALLLAVVAAIWPTISVVFEDGGVQKLVEAVQNAGAKGVFMLLGFQLLQVIVAFIPGEVVQMAAGMMYGPWLGGLIAAAGALIASAIVFGLVHWLGAPFVRDMISPKYMDKFRDFEASGKLGPIVFILFLIPGMPKDVFTYLLALTDMRIGSFLAISTIARLPGIFVSTYAASSVIEGSVVQGVVVFVVAAVIAIVCILMRDRIMEWLGDRSKKQDR